ncbi:hypothetical protein IAQ61_004744 [Plenodomus lingam]|uniref:uncharacterized protein n=1 Tax=Leptosphaeria maculans TaxID=5022 RepID=UPI00332B55C5|nr:hypothetical protein IAQ61_004744 [Plenodomus lingam]
MDNETATKIQPVKRHLGHALLDVIIRPILRISPLQIFQKCKALFVLMSTTQRMLAITIPILFVIAEYEQPGFLPNFYGLINSIIICSLAVLFVFAIIALTDWYENAVWPWDEPGWVWPWERWFWASNLTDSEFSMSTSSMQDTEFGVLCEAPREEDVVESVEAEEVQESEKGVQDLEEEVQESEEELDELSKEPVAAFQPASPQGSMYSPSPSPSESQDEEEMAIPPTPLLPRGMRSESMLPPPTPADIHRSGLLGESPMPPRFQDFDGNPYAMRTDARSTMKEWGRPAATSADKAKALKIMNDSLAIDREEE